MPRSIQGRLTAWLAVLIATSLILLALLMYLAVSSVLTGDLDHTLRAQAQQVASSFDFGASSANNSDNGQHTDFSGLDQFATAGIYVETFDARGHLLARSSDLGARRLAVGVPPAALLQAPAHLFTIGTAQGLLRVISLPVQQGGHRVGLVLVASALSAVEAATRAVLLALVAGGLGVLILAAVGAGVLVRRALRPLDEMAGVVESVNARQLDSRLRLRSPPREIVRLAGGFDAMLDRLHDAFAAQRRFVADASHELRAPLALIRGRSDVLLLDPSLSRETRDGLTMMRDEAARMGRLVANLLLVARGDEARAIDRRPVELDVLLLEAARHAADLARGVTVRIGREDQALVLGDADLLKQVLLNLVDNAVSFTPPGGAVELSLCKDQGSARLAVGDTGPGIAPDDLARIFERFYRPDPARTRRNGGAGLGLAIAHWIARAHGGDIEVRSAVGRGSTFTLVLPLHGSDSTF